MAIVNQNILETREIEITEVKLKPKKGLFGLITWKKKISENKIGEELFINIEKLPEKIYINGQRYIKK